MSKRKYAIISILCYIAMFLVVFSVFYWMKTAIIDNTYPRILHYSEELYEDYQEEAENLIAKGEFVGKYPYEVVPDPENNRAILTIKSEDDYKDYMTVTITNYGTNEQEVIFEKSRESAQEAYKQAERYKNNINTLFTAIILACAICIAILIIRAIMKYCTESDNSNTADCKE